MRGTTPWRGNTPIACVRRAARSQSDGNRHNPGGSSAVSWSLKSLLNFDEHCLAESASVLGDFGGVRAVRQSKWWLSAASLAVLDVAPPLSVSSACGEVAQPSRYNTAAGPTSRTL